MRLDGRVEIEEVPSANRVLSYTGLGKGSIDGRIHLVGRDGFGLQEIARGRFLS